jgi:cysteinyl-tRNA synthetase
MSKTEGNIFQLSEALDRYGRETIIDYLLSGRYRQPLAFSAEQMEQAAARVKRVRNFLREHPPSQQSVAEDGWVTARREDFRASLADDFNTPQAMAEIFDLVTEGNRRDLPGAPEAMREMLSLVGLESLAEAEAGADSEAEALLAEREEARAAKDFARADQIRNQLAELGWEVRDSAEGARLVPRG